MLTLAALLALGQVNKRWVQVREDIVENLHALKLL